MFPDKSFVNFWRLVNRAYKTTPLPMFGCIVARGHLPTRLCWATVGSALLEAQGRLDKLTKWTKKGKILTWTSRSSFKSGFFNGYCVSNDDPYAPPIVEIHAEFIRFGNEIITHSHGFFSSMSTIPSHLVSITLKLAYKRYDVLRIFI